jgi:hypothetical protein
MGGRGKAAAELGRAAAEAGAFIYCRVPAATKAAFGLMARRQGMTDSVLLRRTIDLSLQSPGVVSGTDADADRHVWRGWPD